MKDYKNLIILNKVLKKFSKSLIFFFKIKLWFLFIIFRIVDNSGQNTMILWFSYNFEFDTIHKNKVIDVNNEIIVMKRLLKKNLF